VTEDAADKMARYAARPKAEEVAAQVREVQESAEQSRVQTNGQAKSKGIACPFCHVINFSDVRKTIQDDGMIRRRRLCRNCGKRFGTYEMT